MGEDYSVSCSVGTTAEYHDKRIYTPNNADKSLSKNNVHLIGNYSETDADAFNRIFEPSVAAYNKKQKRKYMKIGAESSKPERQKTYYDGILDGTFAFGKKGMLETPVEEVVLQIGNNYDNGLTDSDFDDETWYKLKREDPKRASAYVREHLRQGDSVERSKRILSNAVHRMAEMDPEHLVIIRADLHADEPCGTPHVHVAFTLRGTGYKQGMAERVSMSRACEQMGLKYDGTQEYGIVQLFDRFKDILEEEMARDGLENGYESWRRKPDSGEHRRRLAGDEYRRQQDAKKEADEQIKLYDEQIRAYAEQTREKQRDLIEIDSDITEKGNERLELQASLQSLANRKDQLQQENDDIEESIKRKRADVDRMEKETAKKNR